MLIAKQNSFLQLNTIISCSYLKKPENSQYHNKHHLTTALRGLLASLQEAQYSKI